MIVFYSLPNTMTLPYVINKVKGSYRFIPGKNHIAQDIWTSIVKAAGDSMDYYNTVLRVFQPILNESTQIEVGEEFENVDLTELNVRDMKELIENTMDSKELIRYEVLEKDRDRPRTSILKALKDRIRVVSDVENKLSKKED